MPAKLLGPQTPVSVRFIALVSGRDYASCSNLMRKLGVMMRYGGIRHWGDVVLAMKDRIIDGATAELLARHVPAAANVTQPAEVEPKVYDRVAAAWKKIGAPGSNLLARAKESDRRPRGRPRKIVEPEAPVEVPVHLQIEKAKLQTHEQNAEWKRVQIARMSGMLCDRASVKLGSKVAAMSIQRELAKMPAMVAGAIKQTMSVPDDKLREIERVVQGVIPNVLSAMREALVQAERDSVALASSQRYGARGWSVEVDA